MPEHNAEHGSTTPRAHGKRSGHATVHPMSTVSYPHRLAYELLGSMGGKP